MQTGYSKVVNWAHHSLVAEHETQSDIPPASRALRLADATMVVEQSTVALATTGHVYEVWRCQGREQEMVNDTTKWVHERLVPCYTNKTFLCFSAHGFFLFFLCRNQPLLFLTSGEKVITGQIPLVEVEKRNELETEHMCT